MQSEKVQENEQKSKIVKIATMVRIRPLLQCQRDFKQSIKWRDQSSLEISLSGQLRKQNIQKVFSPQSTQRQVFNAIEPMINKCGSGYNVTIFTYGQTGSGKTHTMFGSDWNNIIKKNYHINTNYNNFLASNTNNFKKQEKNQNKFSQETFLRSIEQDQNHSGLIPRSIHHLFGEVITKRRKYIKVYCSFLQLYNQTLLDLLQDDAKLAKEKKMYIHQNPTDGIYIEGLNQMVVDDADQCLELMKKGERNRVVRQTSMNIKSSRSHTIFQLLIEEVFPQKKTYRRMKLNLCDLAGSEKINKYERMENDHFEQLKNINLSLTTLGKVISALSEKTKAPFRESKLSRLLQDSLGGNTYTAIIATITTKSNCLDESLNTLKFLERAKQIKSQIISKQITNDNPQMKNLQKQIAYLKDILKLKRTGADIIDVNLNEKYKRLQQQNSRLKELVDQELIEKLKRQNNQLKSQLQRKNNDDLSENLRRSGYTFAGIESQQGYRMKKQHRTIQDIKSDLNSNKDQVHSQYRGSSFKKKSMQTKTNTQNNRSTNATLTNKQIITKISLFPAVGKRANNLGNMVSANKILERIQQIEKVKIINKLKLEKQLESINKNNLGHQKRNQQITSVDSSENFARVSKYSSKYRY